MSSSRVVVLVVGCVMAYAAWVGTAGAAEADEENVSVVRGFVYAADGTAAPRVTLTLRPGVVEVNKPAKGTPKGTNKPSTFVADEAGGFTFEVPPGEYTLFAGNKARGETRQVVQLAPGQVLDLKLTLSAGKPPKPPTTKPAK